MNFWLLRNGYKFPYLTGFPNQLQLSALTISYVPCTFMIKLSIKDGMQSTGYLPRASWTAIWKFRYVSSFQDSCVKAVLTVSRPGSSKVTGFEPVYSSSEFSPLTQQVSVYHSCNFHQNVGGQLWDLVATCQHILIKWILNKKLERADNWDSRTCKREEMEIVEFKTKRRQKILIE